MFNKFNQGHGSHTVTNIFGSGEAHIVVNESELELKRADAAGGDVALINPSFERNLAD